MNSDGVMRVITETIRKHILYAVFMVVIVAASIIASLLPPLVLENIVDEMSAGIIFPAYEAALYFILVLISGVLESGQNTAITIMGQRITRNTRQSMCDKLTRLPASYYVSHETGKVTSRFINDADALDSLFTNGIINMFADCCKIISILAIIFYKSRGLFIMMLVLIPALFAMTRIFQKKMLYWQILNRKAIEKVNNHVPETIKNIRTIRVLHKQAYMERIYDRYITDSYTDVDRVNIYDSLYSPIVVFINSAVIAVLMTFSSAGTGVAGFFGITVGSAVAIMAYVGKVFDPIESIGMEIQNIQSAVAAVKRINEFLKEDEISAGSEAKHSISDAVVELKNVNFSYDGKNNVLRDFSLFVEKGEKVIITGRTGAGKSTIFKLISGLITPDDGDVYVNGTAPDRISEHDRRHVLGVVEQSFSFVEGNVREQIRLYDNMLSDDDIWYALEAAGLKEKIEAMPEKLDGAANKSDFSQGEIQLLAIARAMAGKPEIILLDEITANLDSNTEKLVLDAIERVCDGRTVVSISHRLSETLMSDSRMVRL